VQQPQPAQQPKQPRQQQQPQQAPQQSQPMQPAPAPQPQANPIQPPLPQIPPAPALGAPGQITPAGYMWSGVAPNPLGAAGGTIGANTGTGVPGLSSLLFGG
jgi:hypothetical protein